MGFFSDVKSRFKKATGLGDPFGTKATVSALREAGKIEEAKALENRLLMERILGIGEPFRERADIAGQRLLDIATAPIGGEDFETDLREAIVSQRATLGGFGLTGSTTEERTIGETTARAIAKERGRKAGLLQFLVGGAEAGVPGALSAQQLSTQAALSQAQSIAGTGQAVAAGKQFGIQTLSDLLTTGGTVAALA
jgi:hypothetical protein